VSVGREPGTGRLLQMAAFGDNSQSPSSPTGMDDNTEDERVELGNVIWKDSELELEERITHNGGMGGMETVQSERGEVTGCSEITSNRCHVNTSAATLGDSGKLRGSGEDLPPAVPKFPPVAVVARIL